MVPSFVSFRTLAVFCIYVVLAFFSLIMSFMLRFDFNFSSIDKFDVMDVFWVFLPIKIFLLAVFGQFKGLLTFFHIPDLLRIFWAMICSSLALYAVNTAVFDGLLVPRGVILTDFVLSTIFYSFFRLSMRMYRERFMRDTLHVVRKKRVAIIAISNFSKVRIAEITSSFSKIGVETGIVPSYYDLASGFAKVSNFREVAIEDILGREQVPLDSHAIDEMVKNKVVMVTGAGGSIGSELCRQIAMKSPSLLIMVDHCEVQLFQIEQKIIRGEYGINIKPLVGSVSDERRMDRIISTYKPQIIFHAAAHKHVPMMESQPGEALKNNTYGTWNIAEIASTHGVEKFLLISTDKAINPTNVMGATKRLAEKAIQAMQNRKGNSTQFVAVRFGNVLGSSGSVIPTFKRQIEEGGPVTVTHPEVTRYFMTIPEAVGLVLQCGAQAVGGEIFVLDMGDPVKVIDLARHMIRLSGFEPDTDIKIKIIGLRPGEKLYEELQHKNEELVKTSHPRIFGFISKPPSYSEMKRVVEQIKLNADNLCINDLKRFIFENVPEYKAQFYD